MPRLLQPSFGGGEHDPELWGRQDLARYGISARLLRGWIVKPTGAIERSPGTLYCAAARNSARPTRFLRFQVSADLSYLCALNDGFIRFIYRGALVLTGGGLPVEIAHPSADVDLPKIRTTQSADTAFLQCTGYAPRTLKRTSATSFALALLEPREGPFRALNANQAHKLAASGSTGTVTITANIDTFTSGMVGSLIYLEPEALGTIRPWVQGERTPDLAVGQLRRSEGKVYRAYTVQVPGGGYCETGNVRPIHETGREWDGPGDTRTFSGTTYRVGVEWEYVHSGYGIAQITAFTNSKTVTAVVLKALPPQVVGGVGTPAGSWTFSGTNGVGPYTITGATLAGNENYTVTINGVPIPSDPYYNPPGGGHGGIGEVP